MTITKNSCIKINCLVSAYVYSVRVGRECQKPTVKVALVLITCFHKKMIGLVLCGVSVASNILKTMTINKLYQRFDLYVNLHAEFNLARYQTTIFAEFWFRKIGPRTIKLALIKQRQNVAKVALFVLFN